MTAVDFMCVCIGLGAFSVCVGWTVKTILDVKARNEAMKVAVKTFKEEPPDPMNQRLLEFRNARFGRPLHPGPMWTTTTTTRPPRERKMPPHLRPVPTPKNEDDE
jgi:hypothetical protein